jgi:hypothetical protein
MMHCINIKQWQRFLLSFFLCLALVHIAQAESSIAPDQRRSVEQTFLTFPEWYLVHSPAEYATYVSQYPAHEFPFIQHIQQLWSSYVAVTQEQIRAKYPANLGYHIMIMVIASSTTVEYALRWAYENTVGRISWATTSKGLTAEDLYGAQVAQDYVNFIRQQPWYLYDFSSKLEALWSTTPAWGSDLLRKWERRYALTTEYVVKAAYAKLIKCATATAYEPALMTTQVVVDRAPSVLPDRIKLIRTLGDGRSILELPRYFDFRIAASQLAQEHSKLVDIAGNSSVILTTAWVPYQTSWKQGKNQRILFEQTLVTLPGYKRVALILPVVELSDFLSQAEQYGLRLEHIYDY